VNRYWEEVRVAIFSGGGCGLKFSTSPIGHRTEKEKVEIMYTPASIKGHPLHPLLVTFPIGLWIFSLASDIISFGRLASGPWSDIAFYTMAGGIAGALLAALPGLIDLLSISEPRMRRVGITHMTLNLIIVALYCVNWAIRLTRATNPIWPFIMSIIGIVLLCVSGWLGATLVHKYRVTVQEPITPGGPLPAT
jgi:uncharacterized membrane protein